MRAGQVTKLRVGHNLIYPPLLPTLVGLEWRSISRPPWPQSPHCRCAACQKPSPSRRHSPYSALCSLPPSPTIISPEIYIVTEDRNFEFPLTVPSWQWSNHSNFKLVCSHLRMGLVSTRTVTFTVLALPWQNHSPTPLSVCTWGGTERGNPWPLSNQTGCR